MALFAKANYQLESTKEPAVQTVNRQTSGFMVLTFEASASVKKIIAHFHLKEFKVIVTYIY